MRAAMGGTSIPGPKPTAGHLVLPFEDAPVSDVADWLSAKYPQLTYKRVTMVSSLALLRQKQRRTAWEGWASSGDSPSVEELKRVKQMADERGGLVKVASLIEQVDEMVKAAGGYDKLKAAVASLLKLSE